MRIQCQKKAEVVSHQEEQGNHPQVCNGNLIFYFSEAVVSQPEQQEQSLSSAQSVNNTRPLHFAQRVSTLYIHVFTRSLSVHSFRQT